MIKIYQINPERDKLGVKFVDFMFHEHLAGTENIDPSIYDKVYDGDEPDECDDLESIYEVFNRDNRPEGFCGHSLSVSDIVEIPGEGFFYCDSIGFREVDFDPSQAQTSDTCFFVKEEN